MDVAPSIVSMWGARIFYHRVEQHSHFCTSFFMLQIVVALVNFQYFVKASNGKFFIGRSGTALAMPKIYTSKS
jgi:chromate transport protein ChrA